LNKTDIVCLPERFHWLVSKNLTGTVRADSLIKQNLPVFSRRNREDLFSRHAVRVNGRPVSKGFRVRPGDRLEIDIPGPISPFLIPEQVPKPSVAFEDHALLIIEKPGLTPTHPLGPFETGTLANALVYFWPRILGVGNKPLEPGLVHRLDNGTSGLLAVALKQDTWSQMKKDLSSKRWEKTYWALVEGTIRKPMRISLPLAHDPSDNRKMKGILTPNDTHRGRIYQAVTQISPMKSYQDHTLVEIQLVTGVSHQIRAHLSFQGHPVVGDILYGSTSGKELGLSSNRFFLHAKQISLPHPITRERITCIAELSDDLQKVLSGLG
jgi:23S rRNA pseudouridine1911/1915/1917 synthase